MYLTPFFMIRSFTEFFLAIAFIFACPAFGQPLTIESTERAERARKLADLMARVSIHEAQVTQLLSKGPVPTTDFSLPEPPKKAIPAPATPPPPVFIPVPDYPEVSVGGSVKEVPAPPSFDDLVPDPGAIASDEPSSGTEASSGAEGNSSVEGEEDLEDAYAKLYDSDIPSRHTGYYFGPLIGFIFPSDVATREPNTILGGHTKTNHESDSGFLIGLQAGKDFGTIRVEGEYTYNGFDASGGLKASVHNFLSRLILEKELGDRIDLRTGLGMGFGFVNLQKVKEYTGMGFAYDFLLGCAYRIGENWGLQIDYRYSLTSANDEYDRLKSHAWLFSASVDL